MKSKKKTKIENPKHDAGIKKVPFHYVPCGVLMEIGLGMMEGGRKYGAHNYRAIRIKFSDYYDAAWRHLSTWWEGEDIDPDSKMHHITKLITDLIVLRDSMLMGNYDDDRPIKYPNGLDIDAFNKQADEIIKKHPDCIEPFTEKNKQLKSKSITAAQALTQIIKAYGLKAKDIISLFHSKNIK